MSFTSLVATRHLFSPHRSRFVSFITLIAVVGVALGTATLIVALSVLGGFEKEITDKVIGFAAHVQVLGFHNQPLRNYNSSIREIEDAIPSVRAIAPFVAREALIRSRDDVDGIILHGVDPDRDITTVRRFIVEGSYDLIRAPGSLAKLVIGAKLARRMNLVVGDKVALFGIAGGLEPGSMRILQFEISGVYESGMAEYDDVYAFTALHDAQILAQLGEAVTGYEILLSTPDSAAAVADSIRALLGYPHYARTMYQTYRNLFSWIELQKRPIPIILGLVIVVATVNIIGTLLMMVLDKAKAIGILMSMGASRRQIHRLFLRKGLIIAIVGTLMGNLLAFALCYVQHEYRVLSLPSDIYFMSSVPVLIKATDYLLVSIISVVLCVLSAVIPSRLASRLSPIRTLRFG